MPRFNLDSFNYNPLTSRSNAAIDSAMRNVDQVDAELRERRSSNPKPQSRKSTKRRGAGYRKRNVQQPKPVTGDSVTVQAGDSLSAILKRTTGSYKNVAEVARLNGIKDPNKIYVGQKIKIPGYKVDAASKPAADSAKPADVKPVAAAAATSVVKDSVVAPRDTTTIVRNDSIPVAPRDSVATTAPADTTSESGYERARAHAMQLLREREARKQRERNGESDSAEANSRVLNLGTEKGKRLVARTQENYGRAQYDNDIKGVGGLGLAGAGSATTRVAYKMLRNIIKKGDVSLSSLFRGSLAPYGGKSLRNAIANGFERAIKGAKETVKPKPAKIGEQASRFAKGVTRRSKEVVQPTRTKIGEQATGYVKNGITRRERSNVIENAGPYLTKGEEASRSLLSRVRGKLEGVVARRRGYTDNGMPATSKAGSGVGGNGTQSYIINSGGTPRWRIRQMEQATKAKPKPTQSAQSSASSTQSPKPTRTQSRKQKMRGNQSKNDYRQAQRAKRNQQKGK